MTQKTIFDPDLIERYDASGPRYTSYPTAVQFHEGFDEAAYREAAARAEPRNLSLYFHIPFCATLCFYCACNKVVTKNRAAAAPYLERLHREIELQAALFSGAQRVDQLHWGGGTPTFISHDEMRALMDQTRRHFTLRDDDGGDYSIEVDPRKVDAETIAVLREIGFNRISVGVQDFDPAVQQAVNRNQSEGETRAVIEAARERGFRSVNVDLIYGLPHQTPASFQRTLERVLEIAPDRVAVYNYAHLPQMFMPQRRIRAEDLPTPAQKLEILQGVIDGFERAGYVYIGMDHFARPDDELAVAQREGTLTRTFQGYTTHGHCDIVAMGITSIGRVGDSYSQNAKTLEEYCRGIDQGHIPIIRGVRLDDDDKLRRDVIMKLICSFELDMEEVERKHGIEFGSYFAPELDALVRMADDGLLDIDDQRIVIRPAGRMLIRNVCMVFDRYLRERQGRFSKVI